MEFFSWLQIALVCVLGAVSPGPSLAVVVRNTISGGKTQGVLTGIGHGIGLGLYAFIAITGLSTLDKFGSSLSLNYEGDVIAIGCRPDMTGALHNRITLNGHGLNQGVVRINAQFHEPLATLPLQTRASHGIGWQGANQHAVVNGIPTEQESHVRHDLPDQKRCFGLEES